MNGQKIGAKTHPAAIDRDFDAGVKIENWRDGAFIIEDGIPLVTRTVKTKGGRAVLQVDRALDIIGGDTITAKSADKIGGPASGRIDLAAGLVDFGVLA